MKTIKINYKPTFIKHNNKDYFICLVRKKLIQAKPEEILRQQILYYLINDLHYPEKLIDVEIPMSYFKKGAKGRADIVIFKDDISKTNKTAMLIECKAPDVDIRDYRFKRQIERYNKIIKADFSVLTNGNRFEITDNQTNMPLEEIPTYRDLISKKKLNYISKEEYFWKKHNIHDIFNSAVHDKFIEKDIISIVTPENLFPPIIRMADLFYDDKITFKPERMFDLELIKDYGLRYTNYGYAFSDGLKGYYRYFLFKQTDGNHRIVSFSLYHQYDWGTYLMVAVDERQGHALELKLDRYMTGENNGDFTLWHNGSMTIGKKGRIKNSVVIDYISRKAPYLLKDNKIMLGKFNILIKLDYNTKEIKELIFRMAKYALLREEIRNLYSSKK